jgi:hypothetical protein
MVALEKADDSTGRNHTLGTPDLEHFPLEFSCLKPAAILKAFLVEEANRFGCRRARLDDRLAAPHNPGGGTFGN